MTGRLYTLTIAGTASPAAAFDLAEIVAAAGKPVAIVRVRIGQTSEPTTEEEQLGVTIYRGYSSAGSGGSTPTAVPVQEGDSAFAGTVKTMNTTLASGGSPVTLFADALNTRAGLEAPFAPEEEIGCAGGGRLVVRVSAPADAVTIYATIWIREVG